MSTRTTTAPAVNFDQYDLSNIQRAIDTLDGSGYEFTGTILTSAAKLTVKYDEDAGLHRVTKIEPR